MEDLGVMLYRARVMTISLTAGRAMMCSAEELGSIFFADAEGPMFSSEVLVRIISIQAVAPMPSSETTAMTPCTFLMNVR